METVGNQTTTFYANLAKRVVVTDGDVTTRTIWNPDGEVCSTTLRHETWEDMLDGAGNLIAHIEFLPNAAQTITCRDRAGNTTVTAVVNYYKQACAPFREADTKTCPAGTCS